MKKGIALLVVAGMLAVVFAAGEGSALLLKSPSYSYYNVGFNTVPTGLTVGASLYGGVVEKFLPEIRLATFSTADAAAFVSSATSDSRVSYVVEDLTIEVDDLSLGQEPSLLYEPSGVFRPDDPGYRHQYAPAMIRADEVWPLWTGGSQSNLCFLDTGIAYTHEDLQPNYKGGVNLAPRLDARVPTDNWDDDVHGTISAGLAAARVNNGLGMAGVANVGIYMARVFTTAATTFGNVQTSDPSTIAAGIVWCAENAGPRPVISLSLSMHPRYQGLPKEVVENVSRPMHEAVKYARSQGAIVVAAAGNYGTSCAETECVGYPGRYPEVLSVGCVDAARVRCSISSVGSHLDLVAPGSRLYATWPETNSFYATFKQEATSAAAPHVAAGIALVWSSKTDCSASTMIDVVRATASSESATWNPEYGAGVVDVKAMWDRASCFSTGPTAGELTTPLVDRALKTPPDKLAATE